MIENGMPKMIQNGGLWRPRRCLSLLEASEQNTISDGFPSAKKATTMHKWDFGQPRRCGPATFGAGRHKGRGS